MMFTYKFDERERCHTVWLDGKYVGEVKHKDGGYQFYDEAAKPVGRLYGSFEGIMNFLSTIFSSSDRKSPSA